ncbi:MAG: PrgI family protein [Propionibacteriaceae bacterium]|nr:PrgI family protein [Propionibacteriaceae bacterium]
MALEVRVHSEVTDIDAKVVGPLTWRQFVFTLVGVPVLLGLGTVLFFLGRLPVLPYVVTPLLAPLALWAWAKPMGMRFEKWVPYAWRAVWEPRVLRYGNDPVSLGQVKSFDDAHAGRKNVSRKEAGKRPEAGW